MADGIWFFCLFTCFGFWVLLILVIGFVLFGVSCSKLFFPVHLSLGISNLLPFLNVLDRLEFCCMLIDSSRLFLTLALMADNEGFLLRWLILSSLGPCFSWNRLLDSWIFCFFFQSIFCFDHLHCKSRFISERLPPWELQMIIFSSGSFVVCAYHHLFHQGSLPMIIFWSIVDHPPIVQWEIVYLYLMIFHLIFFPTQMGNLFPLQATYLVHLHCSYSHLSFELQKYLKQLPNTTSK